MKKHKILTYMAFVGLLLTTSCKKFLEHQPDDRSGLNSPAEVADLVAMAYPQANYITMAESMSDLAADKGMTSRDLPNSLAWNYIDQIDANTQDTPPFYWNACYAAIAAANYALEAIDKAGNTAAYTASKGEALVARAYAHFMLVIFFAKIYDPATASSDPGIPYITQPQKTVDGNYTRGTVADVYANIEKDLNEGLPLIRDESYKVPKYHFTKRAAHAFATRFYLFKKEYKKVIEHANAAFPGTTISDNLRPWNTTYLDLGPYELLALYTNSTEPANLLIRETESLWGRSCRFYNYSLSWRPILEMYFYFFNPAGGTFAMVNQLYGSGTSLFIPKFKEHYVRNSISANIGHPYNMIPLFTSEEVLFNRAEASVKVGKYEQALTDINAYLSTRLLSYSPKWDEFTVDKATEYYGVSEREALVESILTFKKFEYIHEGLRWFDIIRLKIPIEHNSRDRKITITLSEGDPRRVLQIPPQAINAGLEPNPR